MVAFMAVDKIGWVTEVVLQGLSLPNFPRMSLPKLQMRRDLGDFVVLIPPRIVFIFQTTNPYGTLLE